MQSSEKELGFIPLDGLVTLHDAAPLQKSAEPDRAVMSVCGQMPVIVGSKCCFKPKSMGMVSFLAMVCEGKTKVSTQFIAEDVEYLQHSHINLYQVVMRGCEMFMFTSPPDVCSKGSCLMVV